jgi:hypothetical protein
MLIRIWEGMGGGLSDTVVQSTIATALNSANVVTYPEAEEVLLSLERQRRNISLTPNSRFASLCLVSKCVRLCNSFFS